MSEISEVQSIWYTEEELQERLRKYDNFVQEKLFGRKESFEEGFREGFEEGFKEGCNEVRREIATKLIQSGMSIGQVSQITKLPLATLESLQT